MKYILSVFLGAVSYGILSTIVVKAYGQGYTLGEVVGTQLLTGFLLAWGLAWFTKWKENRKAMAQAGDPNPTVATAAALTWKHRLMLMAAGMPTAITGLVYYHSLRYIPASLAIILLFQFTWIGVLIQAASQRKRPNGVMIITLIVLFGGTLLAAGVLEQGTGGFNLMGILFGLLAAVSYSLFILFSGKAVPEANPVYRSAWMLTGGLVLVFVLFPPTYLFNGEIVSQLMMFGFLLGLFGAFIPPILFAVGVPHIGGGMSSILGASELPVAVMLSSLVLNEHVSALQWGGVILVLLGVALPELYKFKQRPQARTLSYK
ncbi:drug/metabolite transporter (DMT)-like permease [Paenibacillus phyllosphaerae]|uniref:Drug/metabolite transporter (DMT)-like permease n=1 Tax=Paenibacillus phyllosphaerae TaxID=274593 RepID=A0A7W5FQU1_9BACL|nr:DMT family transporter [Paenibacillus phyllosphaerae]MBB3113816.1 drug/metabolite transporter (DMT)-like permease [Paenibacillus phyllosphaerae]